MGHDHIYHKLGDKMDSLVVRTPWNETFHQILKELYSEEEAEVIVKMPYGLAEFDKVQRATGYESTRLQNILDRLCTKGLATDIFINGQYHYAPSPYIIGVFEFTMMRTDGGVDHKKISRLFEDYTFGRFFDANAKDDVSPMRALSHEGAAEEYTEVLDYGKATAIIEAADRFSIGTCSCRHKKLHLGEKNCDVPLDTCSSFGLAADYLIRRGLAKEVSKTQMLENVARSKELGLVLNADNVQRNVTFICHCCADCCVPLQGISKYGYTKVVVSSGFTPRINEDTCEGCGKCVKACAINAVKMLPLEEPKGKRKKGPKVDEAICLGCGVCALKCKTGALKLVSSEKRVIHPETTFERIILQCLEKGTLQYQLFGDPASISHKFMRGLVGGFLRLPPVKRALMSDTLRSRFLSSLKAGVERQGKDWAMKV